MWEQVDISKCSSSCQNAKQRDASNTCGVLVNLALFPESHEWAEKKEPGTHCLLMHPHFPQNFRESIKLLHYTNRHEACQVLSYERFKPGSFESLTLQIKSFHQQTVGPMPIYLCCSLCGYPVAEMGQMKAGACHVWLVIQETGQDITCAGCVFLKVHHSSLSSHHWKRKMTLREWRHRETKVHHPSAYFWRLQ